ncbi:MAG: alpha/beta hydrolase [Chloroflexi bacterium]|nr:alpha/beta hydrolase [Chloroflexota bacterium]
MRQTAISFSSKGLTLEGVLSTPEGSSPPYPAVLLCHAHPALGGAMESPLILSLARAIDERGIASLRFNFRGVGGSQGQFTNGQEEWQDVAGALHVLERWPGVDRKRLATAGYSFGAQAVIRGMAELKPAIAFVLVSPPLSSFSGSPLGKDKRPRLFLVGERDRLVGASRLREVNALFEHPADLEVVLGADHSWRGHEEALAQRVADFLAERLL